MNKYRILLGLAAVLLIGGAGCSAVQEGTVDTTPTEDTSPIKIGWLGPLTGDAGSLGSDALAGAQIAVDELNEAGGVNGRMLELVAEDGKCNPKDATAAGNKLITLDKVPAIVGGLCSGETTAVAPIAEQNKVVLFSGCSSAPNITDAGDYIFRSYPSDAFQGKVAADHIYNKLGKKKVAVLADLGDWGQGVKGSFEAAYAELGGEIVYSDDFQQTERDFRTQLTKVKSSDAELLYFMGFTEATLPALKQIKELGLELPLLGGDTWSDAEITGSELGEGIQFVIGDVEVKNEEWVKKLTDTGANNTVCAPQVYNNVKILADIMSRVGTDSTMIKDELYKVKDYQGINMSVTIDENGDLATADYVVKEVKDGAVVTAE